MTTPTSDPSAELKKIAEATEASKMLLILMLVKLGTNTEEIGRALGVSGRTVRKWLPTSDVERFSFDT